MRDLLVVLLLSLGTYRVTRLLVSDVILEKPRRWLAGHLAGRERTVYLLSCEWCVSVWVGGAGVLVTDAVTSIPLPALTWAAASAITGLLTVYEDRAEEAP